MESLRFDGQVAVVTGGGRGLGRDHALLLASRGARVVVNDLGTEIGGAGRSNSPAGDVVREIERAGGTAIANFDDVSTEQGAGGIIYDALETFGKVDIVVNNAGILRDAPIEAMQVDDWDSVLSVHLRGSFLVARAAWDSMRRNGSGRIINTSSAAGIFGNAGHANYATAKMGLVGLTLGLALEGEDHNILVNAIAPVGLSRMTSAKSIATARNETVSAAVGWLAHEACRLTGEVLWIRNHRVARVLIGLSAGYSNPEMALEDIQTNLSLIEDNTNVAFPILGGRG
jgi:NAD(P)-dependent dehydrogenase (short-subunit alcohol dehydrogenase family)